MNCVIYILRGIHLISTINLTYSIYQTLSGLNSDNPTKLKNITLLSAPMNNEQQNPLDGKNGEIDVRDMNIDQKGPVTENTAITTPNSNEHEEIDTHDTENGSGENVATKIKTNDNEDGEEENEGEEEEEEKEDK